MDYGRMRTTWVEIIGHGKARVAPNPAAMESFMALMPPRDGRSAAFSTVSEPDVGAAQRHLELDQPPLETHNVHTPRQHSRQRLRIQRHKEAGRAGRSVLS